MAFRIKEPTISWFSNIFNKKPITTQFDIYYLCLMLGLATGRRSTPKNNDEKQPNEFIDYFIDDYKPVRRLIVGLLILSELKQLGLELDEKNDVQDVILKFIDSESPTSLSEEGMKELNRYASGGFDYLAEQLDSKPFHAEEFLRTYTKVLKKATDQNGNWETSS